MMILIDSLCTKYSLYHMSLLLQYLVIKIDFLPYDSMTLALCASVLHKSRVLVVFALNIQVISN